MPQIGNLMVSVYREESKHLGDLIAAMCAAQTEFLPVTLDCDGYRDGQVYKYASIKSIRRSTQAALAKHGLLIHHVYGHSDEGDYVVTVLRHASDQYICSTLRIPPRDDVQERKAAMTLLCRTAIEGLLGIVTEDDDDGQSVGMEVDQAKSAEWEESLRMCKASIERAATNNKVEHYRELAKQRIAEGRMDPSSEALIAQWCADRLVAIAKEDTNARAEGDGRVESTNASGSGSGSSAGSKQRTPATV